MEKRRDAILCVFDLMDFVNRFLHSSKNYSPVSMYLI